MHTKPIIIIAAVLLALALALAAGSGVGRLFEDRSPKLQHGTVSGLPPLPDWIGEPLPDFATFTDSQERKDAFFAYLFPRVALANQRVLTLREQVKALSEKKALTEPDKAFLMAQAERMRIEEPFASPEFYEMLNRRLDVIPPSLVLAQAANESAWGTSRFARQGNNLFGQWCFSAGCGIVPLARADDAIHEVASYDTPYQSVLSYITNLNRHPSYQSLRIDRAQLRASNRTPTGPALAPGLEAYSERGEAYIEEIMGMMQFNGLQEYDRRFSEWIKNTANSDKPYMLLAKPGLKPGADAGSPTGSD